MKRIVFKRVAAVAAAAVLAMSVFALAGCGGGFDSGSGSGGSSSGGSGAPSSGGTTPSAPEEKGASYTITDVRATTWVNSIGTTWVQVIVEITNDGTENLYLGSGKCDLEDESGTLIKSVSLVSEYPEVLAPGEKGYMYEETTLDDPVEGQIVAKPRPDVRQAKVGCVRLAVSDIAISDDKYSGVKVLGRVENTTDSDQKMVDVVAFLYDSDGKLIAAIHSYVMDDLKPGDKVGFEMSGFSLPKTVTASAVASYTVYAYPTQLQF